MMVQDTRDTKESNNPRGAALGVDWHRESFSCRFGERASLTVDNIVLLLYSLYYTTSEYYYYIMLAIHYS